MSDPRYIELNSLLSDQAQTRLKNEPYLGWMATLCAQLSNGTHYIVREQSGHWLEVSNKEKAGERLMDQWGMLPGAPFQIGAEEISRFLRFARPRDDRRPPVVPTVSGVIMVPGCDAHAVSYGGRSYINSWQDTIMKGDPAAMSDPTVREWVELILRMIREGLCAANDVLGYEAMLQHLHMRDGNDVAFRFALSWWSAIIQQPGINLMTNLCHVGPREGIGKGTTQEIMRRIIGGGYVLTAASEEFGRNWTDQMLDRLVICLNEVGDEHPPIPWASFIKRYCNETEITPTKRYHGIGSGSRPNHCNWSMTGNNEYPFVVSESDRRSALFPTTDCAAKKQIAIKVATMLAAGDPALVRQVLQGMAYILQTLPVEHDLIAQPVENALRVQNKILSDRDADLLYWLRNDDDYDRDVKHKPRYWAEKFNAFVQPKEPVSYRIMAAWLMAARRHGVENEPWLGGRNHVYWVPSSVFPREGVPGDDERRDAMRRARNGGVAALVAPSTSH